MDECKWEKYELRREVDRLQRERDEAIELLESLPKWGSYPWRKAAESVRRKLKEQAAQIVELCHERDIALEALRKMRREIERPTPAGHLKRMRRILDKAIKRIEGDKRMITTTHPILKVLDDSDWTFHLVGSRLVGKFSRDSDYDFLAEVENYSKWNALKDWLSSHGFEPEDPPRGMCGPDPRLFDHCVWSCKVEGFPSVDVLPVSPSEAALRLRWFEAMRKAGDRHGGLLAKALKSTKAWPHFWEVLARLPERIEGGDDE